MADAERESSKRQAPEAASSSAPTSPSSSKRPRFDLGGPEAELEKGCAELRRLSQQQVVGQAQATGEASATSSEELLPQLLALLQRLRALPVVDAATLRATGAGREVNQRWLRCHADEGVRTASAALVHAWRAAAAAAPAAAAPPPSTAGAPTPGAAEATPPPSSRQREEPPPKKEQQRTPEKAQPQQAATTSGEHPTKEALSAAFKELSGFEFKQKKTFHGVAYAKVSKVLLTVDGEINSLDQVKKLKLPGVGKASLQKISEYLTAGTISRLERYRNGDFDGDD